MYALELRTLLLVKGRKELLEKSGYSMASRRPLCLIFCMFIRKHDDRLSYLSVEIMIFRKFSLNLKGMAKYLAKQKLQAVTCKSNVTQQDIY
jgi:hypothetical protein